MSILISVTEEDYMSKPTDLVQGTLDLLILKILALEPLHGWAIGQRLKQVSGDILSVSDGSLYPALHKLEQEGWIEAEWKPSENNRRAKFYSLTRLGRKELEKEAANWNRLSAAISRVVKLKEAWKMRLKHWFYTVPLRLRSLFRRAQVEQELDEELRYHGALFSVVSCIVLKPLPYSEPNRLVRICGAWPQSSREGI
jgi:PadR family transcriptional regulator, regulatory protein PadR